MKAPQSTIFNPYIEKILAGQSPTAQDFVGGPQGNPFAGLNLPGMISRSTGQPAPQGDGVFNKIDGFLGKPGGMMLMNLLAQQGYSKMPQSKLGAVGRAALMTSNQQAAQSKAQSEEELRRAQGAYYRSRAEADAAGSKRVVQSAQPLANGNIGYLNAFTGEVIDTGQEAGGKGQVFDMQGVGWVEYDPIQKTLTKIEDERVIREALGARKGAESQASTAAQESTKQLFQVPKQIQAIDDQIRSIDSTIEESWRAQGLVSWKSTGAAGDFLKSLPLIGKMTDAFALQEAIKPIQAALSFDKLQQMRASSPTGGALGQVSERELELLGKALVSLEQAQRPGDIKRSLTKVIRHYENWKSIITQHKDNLTRQNPGAVSGFSIVDPNEDN